MGPNRNCALDIAKAICIILMVIGHSGCPDYLHRFIYMFHMPCFFFISGYLLNDKYLTNLKTGLWKKIKGSYYPFIKWSMIFLLLHNVFAYLHIYDASYSLKEIAIKFVRILTMTGSEQLLGGFWFLISLCWASIATIIFFHFMQKINNLSYINIFLGVILLLTMATLWNHLPIKLPAQFGEQTLLATAFYMSGYIYRKIDLKCNYPHIIELALFIIPIIAAQFTNLSMDCKNNVVLLYYVIAICGTIATIQLSRWLSHTRIASLLSYIGDKTLYILIFHFLSFKLVSYVYIEYSHLPLDNLAQFPVLKATNSWMWIVYTFVGISLSLLIWELKNKVVKCLMNLTHTNHFRKV